VAGCQFQLAAYYSHQGHQFALLFQHLLLLLWRLPTVAPDKERPNSAFVVVTVTALCAPQDALFPPPPLEYPV
jgi:hypothetical protein